MFPYIGMIWGVIARPFEESRFEMAAVAQLAELLVVVQAVVGSSPTGRPERRLP